MTPISRARYWLEEKPPRAELVYLFTLTILWALYFWRMLTPQIANQVSFPEGDFSGQFVAFGAYQARRLLSGEIPLWNPYNNGGLPFLADTQAAVFYPPRLLTILLSHLLFDGWSYAVLQAEVIAHFWLASVLMYWFVRTTTRSRVAGIVSGIVLAYGGYLTGYPALQLAVLEAGIWLPVALLGIFCASETMDRQWIFHRLILSALALGMSLLAGHPQTGLYISYLLIAFTIYRAVVKRLPILQTGLALAIVCGLGYGMAAIQLLPGFEYAGLTTRASFGFAALSSGFPFADLLGFVLPGILSHWSPLYFGIAPLTLAFLAMKNRAPGARFWVFAGVIALLISFGGRAVPYQAVYLTIPGFSLFRGQERAAFIIAHSGAILAGLGTASLIQFPDKRNAVARSLKRLSLASLVFTAIVLLAVFLFPERDLYGLLNSTVLLAALLALTWILVGIKQASARRPWWALALVGLVVFDLFTVTMGTDWEPIPASKRQLISSLVPVAQSDESLYRVDGRLGLGQNYGTMVGVQDIRGVSPLMLATQDAYLQLPSSRLYQLLSVKYVFTDWKELEVPSTILAESSTAQGLPIYLHEISNPTPRGWMVYSVMVTSDSSQALGWLADPSFSPRNTVILESSPPITLPPAPPPRDQVDVVFYSPEKINLHTSSTEDGILVVSELDYPGWMATVDGEPTTIWRADNGLRSLPLIAGEHDISLVYTPLSVRVGAAVSLVSLALLILLGLGAVAHAVDPRRRIC